VAQLSRGGKKDLSGPVTPRRATNGDLAAVTALWIELTRHHAALDPHSRCVRVPRTRRAG
jgi:hypothetical protein